MDTVNILGVQVARLNWPEFLAIIWDWIAEAQPRMIFYANAHSLNLAYLDGIFRDLFNQADLVYADGVGASWAGRCLTGSNLQKMTGADWVGPLCQQAAAEGWSIYILAGRRGVAERARQQLCLDYPGLAILGTSDGFFAEKNQAQVLIEINRLKPDIVFVGLGSPLQESWIAAHRREINAPVCWAVGALFDYIAGVEKRAPGFVKAIGAEWLWRLAQDPVGKWQRYLIGIPLFAGRVIQQKWRAKGIR